MSDALDDEVIERGVAHFTLTGEFLTEIARDLMRSDEPGKAYRLIANDLVGGGPGEADAVAKRVLAGEAKLVGDSNTGIAVEDDDAQGYKRDVRYIYAGRFRTDKGWYRPRAEVLGGGYDDGTYASRQMRGVPSTLDGRAMDQFAQYRVEYYAGKRERVMEVQRLNEAGRRYRDLVIFEPCGELPMWWTPPNDATAALEDFLSAGRRLDSITPTSDSAEDAQARWEKRYPKKAAEAREAAERLAQDAYQRRRKEQIDGIQRAVVAQAGDDWFDLKGEDGKVLVRVPRKPFVNWALRRTTLGHLAPTWTPVSPSGMKLPMDDPYHNDWWYGAGLGDGPEPSFVEEGGTLEPRVVRNDAYSGPIYDAALREMWRLQYEFGEYECAVLVASPHKAEGRVGGEIVVLPNLAPEHLDKLRLARAVITERGGELAHLAVVCREQGIPIVLVPDATTRYKFGERVTVDTEKGRVTLHYL